VRAHCYSKALQIGRPLKPQEGEQGNHLCNNPWCINPDHIDVGDNDRNQEQKRLQGRAKGGIAVMFKLTPAQITEILTSEVSQRELARRFGVTPQAASLGIQPGMTGREAVERMLEAESK